ncbi:hypothetical protein [Paraburkholderia sp. BL10I2N1]|uniref:portal protein n=1 Tax=Paraburkholderia sp. BL10I2N1 TaxID=1938796 RepID=UPI00105C7444|nr:hypothetical protein [Paraburkholderia sp. BL10I2N1]TDN70419.1 hypothetical protein B0G77_3893 [Paraburkholderia sp. BL10I2N1]
MAQQALNITSGVAPGSTNIGGIMPVKSVSQLLAEDRAAAQAANNEPVVQGFAAHIRKLWWQARQAKEMTSELKMLKSVRQRRGEYDPEKLAILAEQGSTTVYMMLTSNKCRAAASWIRDVLVTTAEDKPWSLSPPPVADMPPDLLAEVMQIAQQQIQQMYGQGQNPSDFDVRQMLLALKDMALAQLQELAQQDADRMEKKMQTQLIEGGWVRAFGEFIDDITTFPSAFMKGPVVRRRPKLKWVQGPGGFAPDVQDELVMEWERVDPFHMYPAPDASTIEDGWLIERHKLHRADLVALLGVDGYSDQAIRGVLDAYGKGGLREWIYVDTAQATAEGKATIGVATNPSELIDALQFWGSVQGQMLLDWGMDDSEIDDPLLEYPVEAWLIGNWVIKAVINPDPLGRKPYYKASYEEVPGAFWGNSVADLCRDTQDICNAAARALVNNMGLASGPQVVYNVDRLPEGEKITQLYPWKIWQVTSDPLSSSQPPMQFMQPQSIAGELMQIYEKFATLADEYTGIPRYMTGDSPSGGAGRTASGMSMLMTNAGKAVKQVISNIDDRVTEPAVDRLYYYNMRYSNDPDLKGAVNVVARGAASLMQKEAAQQRQNEFLQIALSNQIVQQVVGQEGIAELLRNAAKTLDMNVDEIVAPLPILKQRWAQQAAQQQQMQQAQLAQAERQFAQQMMLKHGVFPPTMPAAQQVQGAQQMAQMLVGPGGAPPPGPGMVPPPRPGPGAQLATGAPVTNHFGN